MMLKIDPRKVRTWIVDTGISDKFLFIFYIIIFILFILLYTFIYIEIPIRKLSIFMIQILLTS